MLKRDVESSRRQDAIREGNPIVQVTADWGLIKMMVGRWFHIFGDAYQNMAVTEIAEYYEGAMYFSEVEIFHVQVGMV